MSFRKLFIPISMMLTAACSVLAAGAASAATGTVMTANDASRLLTQATFGPSIADQSHAVTLSAADWVSEQLAMAPTYHQPVCKQLTNSSGKVDRDSRTSTWWQISLTGQDQLRQRVALALSEIMVVSDQSSYFANDGAYEGVCLYYDVLLKNAFGNFRNLLNDVTLSSEMGVYLSTMGNAKANPSYGTRADENYAREVMQLFTIGLVQLNSDGSPKLDSNGSTIATFSQSDIENLARVFTGWCFANSTWTNNPYQWLVPMKAFDSYHDTGLKTIVGGVTVPAGGTTTQDLGLALDTLFKHPNVGPFIGRQLIQKLVTSNPSPAYVSRVAAVFANDGTGVRGNLAAVVRAILLDTEARGGVSVNANFGKTREPLLRQANLWRLLKAQPATSNKRYTYAANNALNDLGQSPLSAVSVFNFFQPAYSPSGEIQESGLLAPEYQLATQPATALAANRIFTSIYYSYVGLPSASTTAILSDLSQLLPYATNTNSLLDQINLLMFGGQMTSAFRQTLYDYLNLISTSSDGGRARLQDALYLSFTSPQFQIQR